MMQEETSLECETKHKVQSARKTASIIGEYLKRNSNAETFVAIQETWYNLRQLGISLDVIQEHRPSIGN
jgi:hypothetical protein